MDVYLHASSLHHINKTKSDAKGVNDDILSKIFTTSEIKESRPNGNVQRHFPKRKNPPKEKLTTKTQF